MLPYKVSMPVFSWRILILIVCEQISSLANSIRTLANMEDPIGHVLKRTEVTTYGLLVNTHCNDITFFM